MMGLTVIREIEESAKEEKKGHDRDYTIEDTVHDVCVLVKVSKKEGSPSSVSVYRLFIVQQGSYLYSKHGVRSYRLGLDGPCNK